MAEEKALKYESLIRAAYREGDKVIPRYGVKGADADIYRRLDIEADGGVSGVVNQPKMDKIVREITTHIEKALLKVQKEHLNDKEFTGEISNCLSLLVNPTKEKIDECIDKAWEAFRSIGLTVS
jgi:hypothetical protein|nr:MAG TPA: hypothetical protein [Caudoviricetes sp.]